jgi:diguanylate cyclase (GGDEF)-like protein
LIFAFDFNPETLGNMKGNNNTTKGTSILVVSTQKDVREILQEAMILAGYQCVIAANGVEALDWLSETRIDVVVTDIKMPSMDGLELTAQVKMQYDADVIAMAEFSDDYTFEEIIAKGASELMLRPISIPELYMRIRRVLREKTLFNERNSAMQKLRESEQRYQELSITDGLTKLFNLRQFYSTLHTELERSTRYSHPLTVLMLDIDDFKKYNDTYGHLEGDKVLIRFAEIIRYCLRQSDSAYRYGGEEFTVILPVTAKVHGVAAAERIRTALRSEVFAPGFGENIQVTVSIGVAQHLKHEDMMEFLRRADQNLYTAKAAGKDQVCYSISGL